jgi:hypothetical protein
VTIYAARRMLYRYVRLPTPPPRSRASGDLINSPLDIPATYAHMPATTLGE